MSDDFTEQIEFDEMTSEEKPDRRLWIIILVVLVVLCCCCVVIGGAIWYAWTYGDQLFSLLAPAFHLMA